MAKRRLSEPSDFSQIFTRHRKAHSNIHVDGHAAGEVFRLRRMGMDLKSKKISDTPMFRSLVLPGVSH